MTSGEIQLPGLWTCRFLKEQIYRRRWGRRAIHHFLHKFSIKIPIILLWGAFQTDICGDVVEGINMAWSEKLIRIVSKSMANSMIYVSDSLILKSWGRYYEEIYIYIFSLIPEVILLITFVKCLLGARPWTKPHIPLNNIIIIHI